VGEVVLRTEIHYLLVHEISLVVGDDGMRKLKVAHDVLPEEFDDLLPCDVGERHYFHSLSEVVCNDQHEPELRLCMWKRTYYIKPPLHERSGLRKLALGLFEDGTNL